ncbi:MAG: hypothetical protein Q8Q89_04055 [bacterium]|nr:hypothetical protein [bacterium]
MRKDKERVFELRRQNKSYKQISRELGVPLGTLAGWLKNELWSQDIRDKLGQEASLAFPSKLRSIVAANKKRWADWHESCRQEAINEFPGLKDNPLFMAGLMLYWGEGYKKLENGQVAVSNSDPHLIRLFYLFLTKAINVPIEKISMRLLLYPDLIDNVQKNLWSKATKISLDRFKKSTTIRGRHPTKRNSYGVCMIRVDSRQLKEKVIKWLDLSQRYFTARYDID